MKWNFDRAPLTAPQYWDSWIVGRIIARVPTHRIIQELEIRGISRILAQTLIDKAKSI